ncbi:MAG: threonine ammonia-lyase [Sphingomonas sp.]|nr:threonine ammonia-lyase [Sphingomonas sp.]
MASPARATNAIITFPDIEAAAARIAGAVMRTPTMRSAVLSERTGADVFLKFENLQHTGAYKERGALNKLLLLDPEMRARGVIAASAGNHAQAVAWHARRLGVPAVIVMPKTTPTVKISQTEAHGAEVVLHGELFDEAYAEALRLAEARGLTFVHPFDDPAVMAGQGTVALELLADAPDLDTLIVPIGGGGLIAGIATAAKALKPGIAVIGAQAELYPSMYARIAGKEATCGGDTIAEGIAVKAPGEETARIIAEVVDDILLVGEREIEHAISLLVRAARTVTEGAGATGLAALLAHPERFAGRRVGLVLSGGNIDTHLLANVLLRDLVRSGRLTRLRIHLQDRPGALVAVMKIFSACQVNIVEINHQRVFTSLPAKDAAIEVACEARDAAQIERLIATLAEEGYKAQTVAID